MMTNVKMIRMMVWIMRVMLMLWMTMMMLMMTMMMVMQLSAWHAPKEIEGSTKERLAVSHKDDHNDHYDHGTFKDMDCHFIILSLFFFVLHSTGSVSNQIDLKWTTQASHRKSGDIVVMIMRMMRRMVVEWNKQKGNGWLWCWAGWRTKDFLSPLICSKSNYTPPKPSQAYCTRIKRIVFQCTDNTQLQYSMH